MDIKISCLVLAAGLSSRMRIGNKLLLKVKNITVIELSSFDFFFRTNSIPIAKIIKNNNNIGSTCLLL